MKILDISENKLFDYHDTIETLKTIKKLNSLKIDKNDINTEYILNDLKNLEFLNNKKIKSYDKEFINELFEHENKQKF